jgi:galactose mutarotase-like enzyme
MATLTIENGDVRVRVAPHYGARVTSLLDKATGRDWMAPGGESPATGEEAVYLANEAVGWDECFPTVSPWDASGTAWGRRLRDHGDIWGRAWQVDAVAASSMAATYATDEFRFSRALSLDGKSLRADYAVSNAGNRKLPYIWALHGLLAVDAADKIELHGIDEVEASYLAHRGRVISSPVLAWPGPNASVALPLDAVHNSAEQLAGKLYASDPERPLASVGNDRGWLDIAWNANELGHLGLWLNYGGWPAPGEVHHIALEPTTAPVDHLGQAIDRGLAAVLAPGETHRWTVTLTCRPPRP